MAKNNGYLLPFVPDEVEQSFHMFYLLAPDLDTRQKFISNLKEVGIGAVFHYVPLHSSPAADRYKNASFKQFRNTDSISDRIVRLPFYTGMTEEEQTDVIQAVLNC